MPTYTFRHKETKEEQTLFMSMSEREKFLEDNPEMEQVLSAPPQGDPIKLGVKKPQPVFNDILNNIKRHHYGSNIQVYD